MKVRLCLVLLLFLIVACVEQGEPVWSHDSQPELSEREGGGDLGSLEDLSESIYSQYLERSQLYADSYEASQALMSVIEPLSQILLDIGEMQNPELRGNKDYWESLDLLNQEIIRYVAEQGEIDASISPVLGRYQDFALKTCDGSYCPMLEYLRRSSRSSQVMQLVADLNSQDIESYYKSLKLAIELKGLEADNELLLKIVLRIEEYLDFLKLNPTEFKRVSDWFSTILHSVSMRLDEGLAQKIFESLNIFEIALQENPVWSQMDLSPLYSMTDRVNIFYDENQENLSKNLKSAMTRLQEREGSYRQKKHYLLSRRSELLNTLGVSVETQESEYFYLIDAVFNQDLDPMDAQKMWLATRMSLNDLVSIFNGYVRIQFLYTLSQSTELAHNLFVKNELPPRQLFRHAINSSQSVKSLWSRYREQMALLQNFMMPILETRGNANFVRSVFEGVDRNIKYTAIYPHMMLLFYHMSREQFSQNIFGKEYQTKDILAFFFNGEFEPLFDYVEDKTPLKPIEIIYSFDLAVRTGVFADFGVNVDEFIEELMFRWSQDERQKVKDHLGFVERRFMGSEVSGRFQEICRQLKEKDTFQHRLYFEEMRESVLFGQLFGMASRSLTARDGSSGLFGNLFVQGQNFFIFDSESSETLEVLRVDMPTWKRMAGALLLSYRGYLQSKGLLDENDFKEQAPRTHYFLEKLDELRNRYLSHWIEYYDKVGDCYTQMVLEELEVRRQLIHAERAFLRQVIKDIEKLREGRLNEEEIKDIQEKYRFNGLPSNYKGLSEISEQGFSYNALDFLIRISKYLKEGLQTEDEKIEPIASGIDIHFGERLDDELRFYYELKIHRIPYINDAQFLTSAMSLILNPPQGDSFVWWNSSAAPSVTGWTDRLKDMSALLRIGELPYYPRDCFQPEFVCQEMEPEYKQLVSVEEYLNAHKAYLKKLEIPESEREYLRELHIGYKIDPLYLDGRLLKWSILNSRITSLLSLFELPAFIAKQELLGWNFDIQQLVNNNEIGDPMVGALPRFAPKRYGYMELGREYYNSRSNRFRLQFLFEFNSELDAYLDKAVYDVIAQELKAFLEVEQGLKDLVTSMRQRPLSERVRVDLSMSETYYEPLLNEEILKSHAHQITDFHRATGYCFSSSSSCRDFE